MRNDNGIKGHLTSRDIIYPYYFCQMMTKYYCHMTVICPFEAVFTKTYDRNLTKNTNCHLTKHLTNI